MTDDTTTRTDESTANRREANTDTQESGTQRTGGGETARSHAGRGPRRSDRDRSGYFRRMRDVDHSAPVDGPARTFERNNEGRPVTTDGGVRRAGAPNGSDADGSPATAEGDRDEERAAQTNEEETTSEATGDDETDAEPSARRMSDVDHTSPVEGHVRVFDRGDRDAQ